MICSSVNRPAGVLITVFHKAFAFIGSEEAIAFSLSFSFDEIMKVL